MTPLGSDVEPKENEIQKVSLVTNSSKEEKLQSLVQPCFVPEVYCKKAISEALGVTG